MEENLISFINELKLSSFDTDSEEPIAYFVDKYYDALKFIFYKIKDEDYEVDNISVTDDGMCISFKCTSETSANDIKDRLLDGERIKNVNVTKDIISIDI